MKKFCNKRIVAALFLFLAAAACNKAAEQNTAQPQPQPDFNQTGNLVKNNPDLQPANRWYLLYDLPGQPVALKELVFDASSKCQDASGISVCDPSKFVQGQRAQLLGFDRNTEVLVTSVVALRDVSLYYYNAVADRNISGGNNAGCSKDAILPVGRVMPQTKTPIQDSIKLLLKGEISDAEKQQGFQTEFPHPGFELLGADLKNSVLTLEFSEVPGFTDGGSCRVSILANQIIKTAKQFDGVREVKFKPETLFQP